MGKIIVVEFRLARALEVSHVELFFHPSGLYNQNSLLVKGRRTYF